MAKNYFDHESLTAKFGGPDVTVEIAKIYLEESPELVGRLRLAGRTEPLDFDRLSRCAHTMKGSLGMLGALPLTELAAELQGACGAKDPDTARGCYERLLAGLKALRCEVEEFLGHP